MGLFQFFSSGNSSEELTLDIPAAIRAHVEMRDLLYAAIEGRGGVGLDPAHLASDSECPLGRWIHDQGERLFHSEPLFAELKMVHAMFHLSAAAILRTALSGDKKSARHMLMGGDYLKCSQEIEVGLHRFAEMVSA